MNESLYILKFRRKHPAAQAIHSAYERDLEKPSITSAENVSAS